MIDGEDFYLDLLFYHRKLRRLVAIDLKLAKFQATDKGQMELYLRWLGKHETEAGEKSPLGLILCEYAGKEQVELLHLDQSSIRVASYLTELPSKTLLQKKLRAAVELARGTAKGVGRINTVMIEAEFAIAELDREMLIFIYGRIIKPRARVTVISWEP